MAASVRFKFRSELNYDTIAFDGAFVSVGELKRLIAEKKRLGADAVAELVLMNLAQQDYRDDAEQLPRSSTVLVKRAPAARSGRGGGGGRSRKRRRGRPRAGERS